MKLQELNEDQSPRLNDNGEPMFIIVSSRVYQDLMDTPIGRTRLKLVPESEPEVKKPRNK